MKPLFHDRAHFCKVLKRYVDAMVSTGMAHPHGNLGDTPQELYVASRNETDEDGLPKQAHSSVQ
jgi:hypothetical protein